MKKGLITVLVAVATVGSALGAALSSAPKTVALRPGSADTVELRFGVVVSGFIPRDFVYITISKRATLQNLFEALALKSGQPKENIQVYMVKEGDLAGNFWGIEAVENPTWNEIFEEVKENPGVFSLAYKIVPGRMEKLTAKIDAIREQARVAFLPLEPGLKDADLENLKKVVQNKLSSAAQALPMSGFDPKSSGKVYYVSRTPARNWLQKDLIEQLRGLGSPAAVRMAKVIAAVIPESTDDPRWVKWESIADIMEEVVGVVGQLRSGAGASAAAHK